MKKLRLHPKLITRNGTEYIALPLKEYYLLLAIYEEMNALEPCPEDSKQESEASFQEMQ